MKAQLTLHKEFFIGETDRRIFGSFIEHLGWRYKTGLLPASWNLLKLIISDKGDL
jgi:alpha-L-arabinofuranosidase